MAYLHNDKELFQRSIRLAVSEASPDAEAIEKDYYELAYNSVLRDSQVELSAMTKIIITSKIASYCIY